MRCLAAGAPPRPTSLLAGRRRLPTSPTGPQRVPTSPDELRRWGHEVRRLGGRLPRGRHRGTTRSCPHVGAGRRPLVAAARAAAGASRALRSTVLADLDRVVVPGTTHWQHPGFHAYFPANTSGPGILADIVSSGLGTQGMLWQTGPACTEVETHVLDWVVDLLDLPERFRSGGDGGGVIQDSASSATLCALLAARERKVRAGARPRPAGGLRLDPGPLVAGEGRPRGGTRRRPGPPDRRRRRATRCAPTCWRAAVDEDRAAGRVPCLVMATIGTTSSLAVDPVAAIAPIAESAGHVAARRRRHGRVGGGVPRAPRAAGGARPGRQLRVQPAQVAVHDVRLLVLLRGRPLGAARRAVDPARVPAQRGHRVGRGHRLPRLAGAAGPAVPGAEAVVRAAVVRGRGPAPPRPRARPPGRRAGGADRGGPAARAGGAGRAQPGLLPPRRTATSPPRRCTGR